MIDFLWKEKMSEHSPIPWCFIDSLADLGRRKKKKKKKEEEEEEEEAEGKEGEE